MCQVCQEFEASEISSTDALKLASVMHLAGEKLHASEIVEMVLAKEVPMAEVDPEMDAIYERELKG